MQQKWKKCQDAPNYFVSSKGLLKNKRGKILKTNKKCNRYCMTSLTTDRIPKTFLVHRLVAKAFIPNPKNLPFVNHLTGDKKDNRVENLEWCTQKQNIKHAWSSGLVFSKVGESKSSSVLDDIHILTLATLYNKCPLESLCKILPSRKGTSPSLKSKKEQIRKIVKGERWRHLNFLFS